MLPKYDEDFIEYLPHIRHAADKVAKKFGNVFVVDELVNEAWIRGRNANRPNQSQFVSRAIWDMKDYVRSLFGRNVEGSDKRCKRLNARANILTLNGRPSFFTNADGAYDNGKVRNSLFDIPVYNKDLLRLENKELVKILLDQTSTQNLEAMVSYYLEGNDLVETGKAIGRNQSTVSTYLKRGRQRCLEVVKEMGLEYVDI
jgi:RNA polymerase sigma factor (sigma-70 family)